MPARRGYDSGTTFYAPIRSKRKSRDGTREFTDQIFGESPRQTVDMWWDFNGNAANYLIGTQGTVTARITGAGPPTVTQGANTVNGLALFTQEATSQVQFAGVDFADQLTITPFRDFFFECMVRTPATALTSVQDMIVGLATAYNSTLASMSKYIWFRLAGSNVVTYEGKDGTTTSLANAAVPATTIAVSTFTVFTIDGQHGPGDIRFFLNDDFVGRLNLSSFAATDLMQPMIGLRKASGTTTNVAALDWLRISAARF